MKRAPINAGLSFLKALQLGLWCLPMVSALVLPAPAPSETGLIGHWTLDENDQDRLVADASVNELHGTLGEATAEYSVAGKFGRAIRFPATGSIRLDRKAAALGRLRDFTVSMWIQHDGGASRQLFTFSDGTMNHRVQVEVHNGRLHFGWQNGASFTGFGTERTRQKSDRTGFSTGSGYQPDLGLHRPSARVPGRLSGSDTSLQAFLETGAGRSWRI